MLGFVGSPELCRQRLRLEAVEPPRKDNAAALAVAECPNLGQCFLGLPEAVTEQVGVVMAAFKTSLSGEGELVTR